MPTVMPIKNEEYGTKEYWDQRYIEEENNDSFDWFKSYADLADLLHEFIPKKSSRILMLGCGNSKLSEDMWEDGYRNIVNIDYSGVLIEQMKRRHGAVRPEMEWHEMDIRVLKFEDGSFDIAIDKGTMDAMMTAKGDVWDPPQQVLDDCNKEVDETLRSGPIEIHRSQLLTMKNQRTEEGWYIHLPDIRTTSFSSSLSSKRRYQVVDQRIG